MKKLFTFPKETFKLKVKSANPAIEDDTEEVELSKRDFEQLKKKMVIQALQKTNGKKMAAAKLLKIDHRKLSRLVEKFELTPTWK